MVFIFREHWAEISEALSRLTLGQGLLALAVGLSYPLLEGVSSWLIVRSRLSHFPLRQGIDNAWMGTFGNVVGLGAGSVPFQTWYLHRRGLDVVTPSAPLSNARKMNSGFTRQEHGTRIILTFAG